MYRRHQTLLQAYQLITHRSQCTWGRNTVRKGKIKKIVRKPQTEPYIEALYKQVEILRKRNSEIWKYAESLESLLDECSQYHHPNVDFRAARPPDPDGLLGQEDDFEVMMGGDDQGSDTGNDPPVMEICVPDQSLQVRWGICLI